jgi:hypothetical protein
MQQAARWRLRLVARRFESLFQKSPAPLCRNQRSQIFLLKTADKKHIRGGKVPVTFWDSASLQKGTEGYEVSTFVVHHDIAFCPLAGKDLLGRQSEETAEFPRGRCIGVAPAISTAEPNLIVPRPCKQHEGVGYDDRAIDGEPLHDRGQRFVVKLHSPVNGNTEERQDNG